MNRNLLRAPVATLVAIGSGVMVLLAYIMPAMFGNLRNMILAWVAVVSAGAILLGLFNLLQVHLGKIGRGENPVYSFFLIVAMGAAFAVTLISGPDAGMGLWVFRYIHLPIETSLMAVLSVTLTFSAARLVAQRTNLYSLFFVAAALLTLLGIGPILTIELPLISDALQPWMTTVLASGGARGILLGVSLGTIATGLRVLLGAERPYGG